MPPVAARLAVVAALAVAVTLPLAGSSSANPSATGDQSQSTPTSRWTTEKTDRGWRVTVTTEVPVPPRGDRAVLYADGEPLGIARESADRRTFTLETNDARVLKAGEIRLGWSSQSPEGDGRMQTAATAAQDWSTAPTGTLLPVDPATPGPYGVQVRDYNLGDEAVPLPALGHRSELRGRIYLPTAAPGRRPVVLFLHGRHASCYGSTAYERPWPCAKGSKPVLSYTGYDAPGRALAASGYVVVSISANAINGWDHETADAGAKARAQLILKTLGELAAADAGSTRLGAGLKGKLNLQRVGLMGHSRGGEGAVRAVVLNSRRARPYGIRALSLVAPTNFARTTVPGVSTNVLLPYCDGDVSDLQGQHYVDDTRYAAAGDQGFRSASLILGANHNYFNAEWTPGSASQGTDDWWGGSTAECGSAHPGRLTAAEQRAVGRAYIAGFFRVALGGDTKLLPLFDGRRTRVASTGRAVVRTEYTAPARARLDVARLTRAVPAASGDATLRLCGDVGAYAAKAGPAACSDDIDPVQASHWTPSWLAVTTPGTRVGSLRWTSRTGAVHLPMKTSTTDVSRFSALTLRAAPHADTRTSGYDLTVRLTDAAGRSADVAVSRFSDALRPLPGTRAPLRRTQLRSVHVPLRSFAGVDLRSISGVHILPNRTDTGSVYLADVAFTRSSVGRPVPPALPVVTLTGTPDVTEGKAGTTSARFTLKLSRPSPRPIGLHFGAAPAGEFGYEPEYQSTVVATQARTIVIPAGTTSMSVDVPVHGNLRHGYDIGFLAAIALPRNALLGDSFRYGLVRDDDPQPTVRMQPISATGEGTVMRIPLKLSAPSDRYTVVGVNLTDGTARLGADYRSAVEDGSQPPSRSAYGGVEAGELTGSIDLRIVEDSLTEGSETFTVQVADVFEAAFVGTRTRIATITDND